MISPHPYTFYNTLFHLFAPSMRPPPRERVGEMGEKKSERREQGKNFSKKETIAAFNFFFFVGSLQLHCKDQKTLFSHRLFKTFFFFQLKRFNDKCAIIRLAQVILFHRLFSHICWHATLDISIVQFITKVNKLVTKTVTALIQQVSQGLESILLSSTFISV